MSRVAGSNFHSPCIPRRSVLHSENRTPCPRKHGTILWSRRILQIEEEEKKIGYTLSTLYAYIYIYVYARVIDMSMFPLPSTWWRARVREEKGGRERRTLSPLSRRVTASACYNFLLSLHCHDARSFFFFLFFSFLYHQIRPDLWTTLYILVEPDRDLYNFLCNSGIGISL